MRIIATMTLAMVDAWTKAGAVAAVIAAGAGIAAVVYGRRALGDARKAVTYDRLREARELVGSLRVAADNTRWTDVAEAAAQLGSVLAVIGVELPMTRRLAETEWNLTSYADPGLSNYVNAAREELEQFTRRLLNS